jgi:hypothetical protein
MNACCRCRCGVKFAVSDTNSGAVLNGLVIGSSAAIVSAIVSKKMSIGCLLPVRPDLALWT